MVCSMIVVDFVILLDPVILPPVILCDFSLEVFLIKSPKYPKGGIFSAGGVSEKINDFSKYTLMTTSKDIWLY